MIYDVEKTKSVLREKLNEHRYAHSLGVAEAARELAERYGENADRAYFAGLVHDITKNTPNDEQLQIIKNGGIILNSEEENNPKLWHAVSGSIFLKSELNVTDEEIISAVRYHTTGKAGMTTFEKIIYIADFISCERDFNGVEYMRQLAYESLDKAAMFALDFCLPDLVRKKQVLHIDSVRLYNELVEKGIKPILNGEEDSNDRTL